MSLKTRVTSALVGALVFTSLPYYGWADDVAKFEKLLADHWQFTLDQDPMRASTLGYREYDAKIADFSKEASEKSQTALKAFLERAGQINTDDLSDADRVNLSLFKDLVSKGLALTKSDIRYLPFSTIFGWHDGFATMSDQLLLQNAQNYRDYISRLSQYPTLSDANLDLLATGVEKGIVHACSAIRGHEDGIIGFVTEAAEDSYYYRPFLHMPDSITVDEQNRLKADAKKAIEGQIFPALKRHYDFIVGTYQKNCLAKEGIYQWPGGKDTYAELLRFVTTTDMTAPEIHQVGLDEVKRIRSEMEQVKQDAKFDGTLKEFIHFLRTDPQFYTDDPAEIIKIVSTISKKVDGLLPEFFGHLPRTSYGLKEIPAAVAPKSTVAFAQPPAADGTKAGVYWVNTYQPEKRPLYQYVPLTIHEAMPGHIMQLALQGEMTLPNFRKFAPYGYVSYTAYIEGWALYTERLGLEMDLYNDPYDNFGRLSYEMWRACRLVVDTGIHYYGWSRQKAIDFMLENTALSEGNVKVEVDRYISFPAQATSYKIGELKIRELRAKAEKELGTAFDIRSFHDHVLALGAVPLDLLENVMEQWIADQK